MALYAAWLRVEEVADHGDVVCGRHFGWGECEIPLIFCELRIVLWSCHEDKSECRE